MEEIARSRRFFPGWGKLPRWLTILLNIFLALTLFYGIIKILAMILEMVRKFFYWFFEKRNFYIVLLAVLIGGVVALIVGQSIGLPIAQNVQIWLVDRFNDIKLAIVNGILG